MPKAIFIFTFFVLTFSTQAQRSIMGTATDSLSKQPVSDVYIMLMSEDGRNILSFSFTQNNGSFSVDVPADSEQADLMLVTSRLGYKQYQRKISAQTNWVEILLQEASIQLREVRITPVPIRQAGDTINYYMSNFVRPQDRNLADVLARMPGIEVQSDGRIQYEGRPINRFYIENMNLLGQRYNIATRNLSPGDIATVQVFENHEPVNMLRDRSDSEQAALNIQLREDAKAKWLRTFDFGAGGLPFLYDANGTLARFARGNQTMVVGKANNTGKDIFQELTMHTLQRGQVFQPGAIEGIPDQLNTLSVPSSFLTRDRARFNESAITSLNQLWRVAENTDLRLNINYGFEREKRERNVETEFRFENQPTITIKDYTSQTVNWHKLENELTYTANRDAFHLEEKLTMHIHWKDAFADIVSNNYQISQTMDLPRMHLKNNTTFSKLLGNTTMGITNSTSFTRMPQSLTVTSPDNLPLFSGNRVMQSVHFNEGVSDTHISFSYRKRFHTLRLQSGVEWVWQTIESELNPLPQTPETNFYNNLSWHTTRLYAEPSHQLNYRRWMVASSASANLMKTDYSGEKGDYFYINPRFRATYDANANFRFNASYSHNIRYGNLNQLQTGYVLKRYNHLAKGADELQRNASHTATWGALYRDISRFFNMNYLGSYSRYKNNLVPANFIQDIYTFTWWEFREQPSTFLMNMLSMAQLFADISLTARLSLSYNQNSSTMGQQGININYTNHSIAVSPSLQWNKSRRLNFDYTMNNIFSGVSMNNNPVDNFIPLINHHLITFLGVSDKLSFTSNLQHFYNKSPDASVSNLLFADLGVRYVFNRVTVNLDWTNILNRKEHITSSFNTINTITRVDKLRPGEVLISFRFKR
jgi:hypothetical protein